MVNINRTTDKDGFVSQTRRRSRSSECKSLRTYQENGRLRPDVTVRNGKNIKVERKVIGASMGRKGKIDVIHVAIWSGNKRRFCWLSFRAGIWLARILKMEANGGDGKLSKWNFREDEDWMLAVREKNGYGEFIRLQVSHNKTYPDTLFFPAGNNGVGWWDTCIFLEDLISSVSKKKEKKVIREELPVNPTSNAWFDTNRKDCMQHQKVQNQLIIQNFDKGLNSFWQRILVVEIASLGIDFEWKEVGTWIMAKFGWTIGFELQPIYELKAVFTVNSFAEFSRVKNFSNWNVGAFGIRIYPWFGAINAIHKPNLESINKQWVGIKGVPYNLWDYSTFKIIGDKFGGLIDVSPESSMATDLSKIRILVVGPVSNGVWCKELIIDNRGMWVEIRSIGETLQPSREDMKPVSITPDRSNHPLGFFWQRKPTPVICNKEDDARLRGSMAVAEESQRVSGHVLVEEGCTQLGGSKSNSSFGRDYGDVC
ncbi:hypothetical protein MKX03_004128 [Papaver bracteatum]|nr:hypothetical protein MKX03_004128 [Papaver bracteatum]